ncbi:MAG TPA: hypothetical protein VHG10_10235 [Glycomyces sp.]|nr:hypothetical protein [Glycomyces sp.]
MFFEEFKASLFYAKLPSHWGTEAVVAVLSLGLVLAALAAFEVSTRTLTVLGAVGVAWFGSRIAIIAVKGRGGRGA